MNSKRKFITGVAIFVLVAAVVLAAIFAYSARELEELRHQTAYESPQDGARQLIAERYLGVEKVEIARAGKEIFDDLWFVEAHVWAAGRADAKGFAGDDYDNAGWFFLHLEDGWAFVPEGSFPAIIGFGKWLFGF